MKVEIGNIKDTLMNQPTPVKKESRMEGNIGWYILGHVGRFCTVPPAILKKKYPRERKRGESGWCWERGGRGELHALHVAK